MKERAVMYLYPEESKAASLKIFQDRTNQIKAFYFTRDNIKKVENLESGTNYAVYFLFNKAENGDMTKVYVGQSKNGAYRMQSHNTTKMFWSHCLMFVTDNNSFDTSAIDYLEYHFIRRLEKSSEFTLENLAMRKTEPLVSIYDRPVIKSHINHIEFLLKAEGITLDAPVRPPVDELEEPDETGESDEVVVDNKLYYPVDKRYKASIYVKDGKFILTSGSYIRRPPESSKGWSDKGTFYNRSTNIIDKLIADGKVIKIGDTYKSQIDLTFNSPSGVGNLVSGFSENGWEFFKDLNELRVPKDKVEVKQPPVEFDYTSKRPISFYIGDTFYDVSSWRDTISKASSHMAQIDEDKFDSFVGDASMNGRISKYFTRNPEEVRHPVLISKVTYIEADRSSNNCVMMIRRMLDKYGMDQSEFEIELGR